ncbi:MAG: type II toxin-antitoxin system YafQ family toxin [bacterium]
MYLIKTTKSFDKSFKKIKKSGVKSVVLKDLSFAINTLVVGEKLPESYCDHKLNGELSDYRECHIKGDLLLVYKIEKEELILVLVELGSHSEIFG